MPARSWLWTRRAVPAMLALVLTLETAEAQMVGARAEAESQRAATAVGMALDHRAIENYITIEGKADLLLGALFDQPPRPLNVHESTRVIYPRSLYDSFENTYNEQLSSWSTSERLTRIWAAKPKNTYYRGFQEDTDVQGEGLPLRPEISIVSTVRLYYATPGLKADR